MKLRHHAWTFLVRHYIGTGEFADAMLRIRENPIAFPSGGDQSEAPGPTLRRWTPAFFALPGIASLFLVGTPAATAYFGSSPVFLGVRKWLPWTEILPGHNITFMAILAGVAVWAHLLPESLLPSREALLARLDDLRLTGLTACEILAGFL